MILKHYINRDIYRTTSAILLVLILIFVSSRFVKYIQLAVDGTISAQSVFSLLALQIPTIAGFLIPLSFFIAILLTFGRLYSDNELVVVHSLGIGQRDLAKMLLPSAFILALAAGGLSTFLTPWAASQGRLIMAEQAAQAKLGIFSAGRFNENSQGNGIVFVEQKSSDGIITGVFSVTGTSDDEDGATENLKVQTAKTGRQWEDESSGINYLVLENGQFSEHDLEKDTWQVTDFGQSYSRIIQDEALEFEQSTKSQSIIDLVTHLGKMEWAEIHWRLAAPISIPLICLLAIPLSRTQPRKGKFSRLLPSILIYLIYVLVMMYSRKLIESGVLPGLLGFWWIHLAMGGLVYWFYRADVNKAGA